MDATDVTAQGLQHLSLGTAASGPRFTWSAQEDEEHHAQQRMVIDDDDSDEGPTEADSKFTGVLMCGGDSDEEGTEGTDDDEDAPLPAHACRYCRCHDEAAVARCHTCKRWFCNHRGGRSASHMIMHLVRARHKEVVPHHDSVLGDSVLECYVCGSRNIFLLGFVPSVEESVVVILCREPCLANHALKDMDWDPDAWMPLVDDRQLLPWIVDGSNGGHRAKKHGYRRVRDITVAQMQKLEELWKKMPDGDLEDVLRGAGEPIPLDLVPVAFRDGAHYCDRFGALIGAEAQACKDMKESFTHENVSVRWEDSINRRKVAVLQLPASDSKLAFGDELMLTHKGAGFEQQAVVVKITATASTADDVFCEMMQHCTPPATSEGFSVKFLWRPVTVERMATAMDAMCKDESSMSAYMYSRILGHEADIPAKFKTCIPDDLNVPGLASLNHSQAHAVRITLSRPLTLIQGPPGTGKTVTSATIVYHMCNVNSAQVLVCSPSNIAVDQLAERLDLSGLNVVRVVAKCRETLNSTVEHLTLHHQLEQFCQASPKTSELHKLWQLRRETGLLSDKDRRRYAFLAGKVEASLLEAADVVCCTCSTAGDRRLEKFRFKYVLIDECTQATEPESLIPLVMGAKHVVMVGDHCQMGPYVMEQRADAAGLGRTLFERLVQLGESPIRLDIQYRMHPCLSEFSSNVFYEGTLQNGVSALDRDASALLDWPNHAEPMFFYNSIAPEEVAGSGTSFLNRSEAALAEKIVTQLIRNGLPAQSIGVITPYEGQRNFLVNYLNRNGPLGAEGYTGVEIASVDSFQGREKEVVVLTCVRSNDHQGIGFLSDWRRLNVALTRARRGLVLIGNARVLARHPLWHKLVSHFKDRQLVVDGPLQALSVVNVALPKPRQLPTIGPAWQHARGAIRDGSQPPGLPLPPGLGFGSGATALAQGTTVLGGQGPQGGFGAVGDISKAPMYQHDFLDNPEFMSNALAAQFGGGPISQQSHQRLAKDNAAPKFFDPFSSASSATGDSVLQAPSLVTEDLAYVPGKKLAWALPQGSSGVKDAKP